MFQIQIKKKDVIPYLLPTPCIANTALQVHIVNDEFVHREHQLLQANQ